MAGGWRKFVILVCPVIPGPFFPQRARLCQEHRLPRALPDTEPIFAGSL